MKAARKAKVRRRCRSRLFFSDGSVWRIDSESAYVIWLAGPGTALRVEGDQRPVQPWEYFVT